MPMTALFAVLLAALTHATWNLAAKRASGARHFVWLYSVGSVVVYAPVVAWVIVHEQPRLGLVPGLALTATAILHLGYSLMLQAGYRASDLSLVYPVARGSGPLLSFFAAVLLLGESITLWSVGGMLLVVVGIVLVAGLFTERHRAARRGVAYGLATGAFIAAYTVNDGWAVKALMLSPVLVDYSSNAFRLLLLGPAALRDRGAVARELRDYRRPVAVVAVLGPLGYILVLYAMRVAPVSHVAPARELATLIGTYFGARLLRERAAPIRIAGAACIVAGVVALAFADAG